MSGSSGAKAATNKPAAANARANPNRLAPESPRKGRPGGVTCPSPQTPTRSPKCAAQPKGSPKGPPKSSPKGAEQRFKCSSCRAFVALDEVAVQHDGYCKCKTCKRYDRLVTKGVKDGTPEAQEVWKDRSN